MDTAMYEYYEENSQRALREMEELTDTQDRSGFRNESGLEFIDVSSEEWRQYAFPGGNQVTIHFPVKLSVGKNGHRLFDYNGVSYYVPKGWILLSWKAKHGQPHFVK